MGTDKRARQKERHRSRMEEARKEAEKAKARRLGVTGGIVLGAVALIVGAIMFFGGDDDGDETASDETTTTAAPLVLVGAGPANEIAGETPCPAEDGEERTTSFENPPPDCLDPDQNYTAKISTTKGDITVELDADAAPITVNNFVVLARYGFYDGIPFHRIIENFAIQAGDPQETPDGTGGPGYTISEEPPAENLYAPYSLAMAKTGEPNSTSSQFFIASNDEPAPISDGSYSVFGKVTEGQDVVDAIEAVPTAGPQGDSPLEQVTIESVAILGLPK